jgi:hypothetical protein
MKKYTILGLELDEDVIVKQIKDTIDIDEDE